MTKKIKILFILLALIIIYSYVITIQNLPDNIIIFQGENIAVNQFMGFKINDETVETSSTSSKTLNDVGLKYLTTITVNGDKLNYIVDGSEPNSDDFSDYMREDSLENTMLKEFFDTYEGGFIKFHF